MTLWLVRAGKYGEREDFALQNNVAVIGWGEISSLESIDNREKLASILQETYPDFDLPPKCVPVIMLD